MSTLALAGAFFVGRSVGSGGSSPSERPELLAMVDSGCVELLALSGELTTIATAGSEAIEILDRLADALPASLAPHADELRTVVQAVEDGDLGVLHDETIVAGARSSSEAIVDHIQEQCGVDLRSTPR